jgi:hypothetical protein
MKYIFTIAILASMSLIVTSTNIAHAISAYDVINQTVNNNLEKSFSSQTANQTNADNQTLKGNSSMMTGAMLQ